MKLSKSIWQTFKEVPSEAVIPSHQLMLRSGLIHKLGSGLYTYMPFGQKVIRKIENIIREELDNIGCQELAMTVVTPAELWKESGRWEKLGDLMLKFKDKGDRELCISPTNEEAVTDVFRATVKSYKQLPQVVYQINTKFRDEIRPRFGLMRAREFTMKDAYSFHIDMNSLDEVYDNLFGAYENILNRIGLTFTAVEADAGDMGSKESRTHEFQVIAEAGEDTIIFSEDGYSANIEKAQTKRANLQYDNEEKALEEVSTPNAPTIEAVCDYLNLPPHHTIKSLVYSIFKGEDEEIVLIQLLGDDELNELKLKNFFSADRVEPTKEHKIAKLGLIKGFIGSNSLPVSLKVLFDEEIALGSFYVIGANKADFHLKGFSPKRDCEDFEVLDLRLAKKGDLTLSSGTPVDIKRGIEVGHIFQLGDKYTKAMGVSILDQNGKTVHPLMGCYGIGVTRILAAAIEQHHDEAGIKWPKEIAPYDVYFALIGKSEEIKTTADEVYDELRGGGLDVLFDDRKVGPGFKFKDSDLLGLPVRVVLGERDYKEKGELEIVIRDTNEKRFVKKENLLSEIKAILGKQ